MIYGCDYYFFNVEQKKNDCAKTPLQAIRGDLPRLGLTGCPDVQKRAEIYVMTHSVSPGHATSISRGGRLSGLQALFNRGI
jgi:hypothetical protein